MCNVKTVVYVDDQSEMIDLVRLILRRRGIHVIGACDGYKGLDTIRQVRPDLVLLDLMMPGMRGQQVCRQMRNDNDLKGIPVVVVTAHGESHVRDECESLAVNGFLIKPFNTQELGDVIECVLRAEPANA